jgi:hypothetical protein
MSNERRNTHYNKKYTKKIAYGQQSNIVTRSNAANNTTTTETTTDLTTTNPEVINEMNVSIEYEANPNENNLNESMISTETFASNDTSLVHKEPPPTIHPIVNPGTFLVTNPAPYNPNDIESTVLRLRPAPATTKWRTQPDPPVVSKPDTYIGYYDMKIQVEASTTPWLELIDATKNIMMELWKWDPAMTVFVYEKKERMKDDSCISCEDDFQKINFRNYSTYFYKGAPLPKSGFRTANVLMTHSLPFEDIMKLAGMTLMEMKCGLFRRTVQAEKTTTIG